MIQEYDRESFLGKINRLLHLAYNTVISICEKDVKNSSLYSENMHSMVDKIDISFKAMNDDYLKVVHQYHDLLFSSSGGYFINALYTIGSGFYYNGNDFDNFKAIVEDVYDAYVNGPEDNMYNASANYSGSSIKIIIDFIVKNEDYRDMPNMRKYLKAVLKISDNKEDNNYSYLRYISRIYNSLEKLYEDFRASMMSKQDFNRVLETRIDYLLNQRYLVKEEYYDAILLYKDRYFYLNQKLCEIEDNSFLRKDIFSRVNAFSINLFNFLNVRDGDKDSFIECMDKVFDSDSYSELKSKLGSIVRASIKYESGNVIGALDIIKELNSDQHKEVYCDEVVSYPTNTMNLISKPKRIIDRMKYLYNRIDSSISYDFIDEIHFDGNKMEEVIETIDKSLKREHSFSKKIFKLVFNKQV